MSYVNMDHAGWVQEQIDGWRRARAGRPLRRSDAKARLAGEGWPAAPERLSPFQARVFDIIGIVGGGIYNAPISWARVRWDWGGGVSVIWRGCLASWDFSDLTWLVLLCHEARIRVSIEPLARQYLRLAFHQRAGSGGIARRHPDLDEAVTDFYQRVPAGHPIRAHGHARLAADPATDKVEAA